MDELSALGWLICRHRTDEERFATLWHIMAPEMKNDLVSKERVVKFIGTCVHFSVEVSL